MPETSGINAGNGIKNIGSEHKQNSSYEYIHSPSKRKIIKLRVGELVKGEIVKVPQKNIAIVRLPIGTLTAELHGQLKPGDSLLLKVEKIQPNLLLKIHSISTVIDGKEIPINEILRILDLPQSKDYFEIVKYIKDEKPNIIRQEVIQIQNFFKNLNNNYIKQFTTQEIIRTVLFFHKINVNYNENILLRFIPLLTSPNNLIEEKITKILKTQLQDENIIKLISILENLFNQSELPKNIIRINSLKFKDGLTLYQILAQINEILTNKNLNIPIKNDIIFLINYLEGQFLNNLLATKININSYILIPLLLKSKLKFIKVLYKSSKFKKNKLKFSFTMDNEEINLIENKGQIDENQLNLSIETTKHNIAEIIKKSLNKLKRLFEDNGYIVNSLSVSSIDPKTIDSFKSSEDKPTNFSVVI